MSWCSGVPSSLGPPPLNWPWHPVLDDWPRLCLLVFAFSIRASRSHLCGGVVSGHICLAGLYGAFLTFILGSRYRLFDRSCFLGSFYCMHSAGWCFLISCRSYSADAFSTISPSGDLRFLCRPCVGVSRKLIKIGEPSPKASPFGRFLVVPYLCESRLMYVAGKFSDFVTRKI